MGIGGRPTVMGLLLERLFPLYYGLYFQDGTLLYRPVDSFRKALDLVPDGFGGRHPDKGTGLRVVVLHKVIDFEGEWANTGEGTASNGLLGNDAEETFHLIDP